MRKGETTEEITSVSLTVSSYTGREEGRKGGQKEGNRGRERENVIEINDMRM